MIEAREFGASLRRARERRGVTLSVIAEQTKVSAAMLAGLERGELSRWPTGIFRRAFVRAYAEAIGLDIEETLTEFLRVHPEDGGPVKPKVGESSMRLSLAETGARTPDRQQIAGVAVDVAVVLCAVAAGSFVGTFAIGCAAGLVTALAWHATGAIVWGTSPGLRLLDRGPNQVPRREVAPSAPAPAPSSEKPEVARPANVLTINPSRSRNVRRDRRIAMRGDRPPGSDARMQR